MTAPPMLRLEGVTVRYAGVAAVAGVDVTVAAGEWVALIGPNGAGKSSLLRAIVGLTPHGGAVSADGRPTSRMSWRQRARRIAYVPQQPQLPGAMSVLDYVLLGRTPHIGYFAGESDHDRRICADLLDRLELAPLADRTITSLSGGETQRAVLARALAQEAPILLLDEPTSALDLSRRVEALELVDRFRGERDLTVLSVLHDLTLAGQFADQLILLVDGVIRAAGTPRDVLATDTLTRAYGGHVRVLVDEDGSPVVVPRRAAR